MDKRGLTLNLISEVSGGALGLWPGQTCAGEICPCSTGVLKIQEA